MTLAAEQTAFGLDLAGRAQAFAAVLIDGAASRPLLSLAYAVFIVAVTRLSVNLLERRGWRATIWAVALAASIGVILVLL